MDKNENKEIENNLLCLHDSWENHLGAYFLPNGNIIFKLFTYDTVKEVLLEIKCHKCPINTYRMEKQTDNLWEIILNSKHIKEFDRYRFSLKYEDDEIIKIKDPCSMYQDAYFKWSILYNHGRYKWTDINWHRGKDKRRISRLSNNENSLKNIQSLTIYELHIGTFTNEGTFKSVKENLKYIADDLKFNAIEIMPVENTYSFNWGYDGVDKYAPNHTYGTPDELKELIDYAHSLGLNVIMDVVPNHLGPDIAQLKEAGPYIEGDNCFGYKFNFENECSDSVRDFIIGAALNWLINYHCDGLRVDMTKFMCSDFTMKELVAEVNYHSPHCFLIAEDGRDNDKRITTPFSVQETDENIKNHKEFIDRIKKNSVSLSNIGFDTEWDFPFHKQIAASVLGSWDCRIKNINDFDVSLRDAQTRVKYIMSHDEIGNIDGTRLITKIVAKELKITDKICNGNKKDICKIAAHSAHKLLKSLVCGDLEKMTKQELSDFYDSLNINDHFPIEQIYHAYMMAIKMHKTVLGKVYSIPGPKMVFQGDESANLAYFKFFRKFSIGSESYLRDKGYEPGLSAFMDSKLHSVYYSEKYKKIYDSIIKYTKDLNQLCADNSSLTNGNIIKTLFHELSDIHAMWTSDGNNEICSISNFSNQSYYKNYGILFPKGDKWVEIFNSDDKKYSGSGKYHNFDLSNEQYKYISIPSYSIIFFKKIC